ncbi:cation efflux family-domain-containing protein [Neurospora hispaniola]|uniref:Cation efflux family-domain-containing protein n=1 Tax=Neurospora hispaniola TaxID=588809 RepID=A0AAJ0I1Q4_9PEZI|nr:cation efflux family-domain-containing protein [Neurospora hispaniola]
MAPKIGQKQRLAATIAISSAFFVSELAVAFKTGSLALTADAFHYLNDLISFAVTLTAIIASRTGTPVGFSFGWQRARLLGAFFNGVFLLALGTSIFLQSIERFITVERVEDPKLMLIMGCVGFTLNIITITFLHEPHDHISHGHSLGHSHEHDNEVAFNFDTCCRAGGDTESPFHHHFQHRHSSLPDIQQPQRRDLGMLAALIHAMGDAINNLGVIMAALLIWLLKSDARFYADPGVGVGIAIMIVLSSVPLIKNSGEILLESAPKGVRTDDIKHDIEKVPGVDSIHELHVWRLDQNKAIASVHVVLTEDGIVNFMDKARTIGECLHAYGIHSATVQPELPPGYEEYELVPASKASVTIAIALPDGGDGLVDESEPITTTPCGTTSASSSITTTSISLAKRRQASTATICHLVCGRGSCAGLACCRPVAPNAQ